MDIRMQVYCTLHYDSTPFGTSSLASHYNGLGKFDRLDKYYYNLHFGFFAPFLDTTLLKHISPRNMSKIRWGWVQKHHPP